MLKLAGDKVVLELSTAMIFDLNKKNFYSLTPLIATLDADSELNKLDILLQKDLV